MIIYAIYKPPTGDIKEFEQFCMDIFSKNKNMKHIMFAGDLNMNVLVYERKIKLKRFIDLMYQRNLIPITNKQTKIGPKSANNH